MKIGQSRKEMYIKIIMQNQKLEEKFQTSDNYDVFQILFKPLIHNFDHFLAKVQFVFPLLDTKSTK